MVFEDWRLVNDLCLCDVQCNAQQEGRYLPGKSLGHPVIARAQMQVAREEGYKCSYIAFIKVEEM